MTLSEYLIEAVASRKTGKYYNLDKLNEKIDSHNMINVLDEYCRWWGHVDGKDLGIHNGIARYLVKESKNTNKNQYCYAVEPNSNQLTIIVCNRYGVAAYVVYGENDKLIEIDFYEWNGRSFNGLGACLFNYLDMGIDMLKTLLVEEWNDTI